MKNLTVKAVDTALYAVCGAMFLWTAWDREIDFYILPGVCFLALAVWEGWTWVRDYRAGRNGKCGWNPSLGLAFVVLAVCQVWKAVVQPTGFTVFMAICWALLGAAYAVKTVRTLRAADQTKEEEA